MQPSLWRDLPLEEQGRLMHRFLTTAPSAVGDLPAEEIIPIVQWTFEQRHIHAVTVRLGEGYVDLALKNRASGENEFTRLYLPGMQMRVTALYDLLRDLEGTDYKRVRMWTFGSFPLAQQHLEKEYPLLVEQRDGSGLAIWFREAQEFYHRKPARPANGKRGGGFWEKLKRRLR